MSLLYDARWQAFDNSGNPLVGATLTVYNTGGTVLASIWRDAALTIAMTNPTSGTDKSDAAGRFGQIFTAEAAIFDVVLKDSLGNTVASYVNVVGLGADTGTFTRDFTNSRARIRGAGGVVYVEAGDPTGDDVGGTMSLGGWLGTQADLITLNGALVNTTGRFKENSKKLPSVVETEATTFTNAATVDIALPNSPTGVRGYEILIWDYRQSGAGLMRMRASWDAGLSYKSGAADYTWSGLVVSSGGGVAASAITTASTFELSENMEGAANISGRIAISLITPDSGTENAMVSSLAQGTQSGATPFVQFQYHGWLGASYGRVTNIRLLQSTAVTMTGKYLVRPIRGMGEV